MYTMGVGCCLVQTDIGRSLISWHSCHSDCFCRLIYNYSSTTLAHLYSIKYLQEVNIVESLFYFSACGVFFTNVNFLYVYTYAVCLYYHVYRVVELISILQVFSLAYTSVYNWNSTLNQERIEPHLSRYVIPYAALE